MSEKSRILAVPESEYCKYAYFFYIKNRLSIPLIRVLTHISLWRVWDAIAFFINSKILIIPETKHTQIDPFSITSNFLNIADPDSAIKALEQLYFLTMKSEHTIDDNMRVFLTICYESIRSLLLDIKHWNEN